MWKLKGCPRCGADLFFERDEYGYYEQCLQCGYLHDLNGMAELKKQPAEQKKELVLTPR